MKKYKITIWSATDPNEKKEILVEAANDIHATQYASAAMSMGQRGTFEEIDGKESVSES